MTRKQAQDLAELIHSLANAAAYHSDSVYDYREQLADRLLEIFTGPDEDI